MVCVRQGVHVCVCGKMAFELNHLVWHYWGKFRGQGHMSKFKAGTTSTKDFPVILLTGPPTGSKHQTSFITANSHNTTKGDAAPMPIAKYAEICPFSANFVNFLWQFGCTKNVITITTTVANSILTAILHVDLGKPVPPFALFLQLLLKKRVRYDVAGALPAS